LDDVGNGEAGSYNLVIRKDLEEFEESTEGLFIGHERVLD